MRKFVRTTRQRCYSLVPFPDNYCDAFIRVLSAARSLAGYAFVNPLSGFSEEQSLCMFRRIVALLSYKDF